MIDKPALGSILGFCLIHIQQVTVHCDFRILPSHRHKIVFKIWHSKFYVMMYDTMQKRHYITCIFIFIFLFINETQSQCTPKCRIGSADYVSEDKIHDTPL